MPQGHLNAAWNGLFKRHAAAGSALPYYYRLSENLFSRSPHLTQTALPQAGHVRNPLQALSDSFNNNRYVPQSLLRPCEI